MESIAASSITAKNVERAFIYDDRYQRNRINAWGEHYRVELWKMGAQIIMTRHGRIRRARRQRQSIA